MKKILLILIVLACATVFASAWDLDGGISGETNYTIDIGLHNQLQAVYSPDFWVESHLPVSDIVKIGIQLWIADAATEVGTNNSNPSSGNAATSRTGYDWTKINDAILLAIGILVPTPDGAPTAKIQVEIGGGTAISKYTNISEDNTIDSNNVKNTIIQNGYGKLNFNLGAKIGNLPIDDLSVKFTFEADLNGTGADNTADIGFNNSNQFPNTWTKATNVMTQNLQTGVFSTADKPTSAPNANAANYYKYALGDTNSTTTFQDLEYYKIATSLILNTGVPLQKLLGLDISKLDLNFELGGGLNYKAYTKAQYDYTLTGQTTDSNALWASGNHFGYSLLPSTIGGNTYFQLKLGVGYGTVDASFYIKPSLDSASITTYKWDIPYTVASSTIPVAGEAKTTISKASYVTYVGSSVNIGLPQARRAENHRGRRR
jgi:hypothetical protein